MIVTPSTLLAASVTLLMGLFYFFASFRVGNLRGQLGIKAPATSGHPTFDRAYRVQINTLEQMGLILPFLWVAALFPIHWIWVAPAIGLVWVAGRILYMITYMADPETRIVGAMIGGMTSAAMFIVAAVGVVSAWIGFRGA
jgi:uncharacterized MAPEG superfamily protein